MNSTIHKELDSYNIWGLDEEMSWNLFCEKVFGPEGCSLELEEVGRKIVKNCKGLPLSIIVIGGLLSKSIRNKKYWESIARDTKAFVSLEENERRMRILSLSYHNLPVHLKPCFLYMGIFPEDEIIRVSWLIKLWVAEGFLKPNSFKELEVIGEEYLNNLISRNLILVHRRGLTGKIQSCMIHDLLREVCLKEAQNKQFLYSLKRQNPDDKAQCISSERRVVVHRSLSKKGDIRQVIKSIKSGWQGRSLICDVHEVLSLKNCRLLRVINVCDENRRYDGNDCKAKYSLDDTFQLFNLRFIAINNNKRMFPSSFSLLWNVQILIVKGNYKGPVAPSEIWEMVELRHVKFDNHFYLPDPPSSQRDVVMKNLQTLKKMEDFTCSDEVVKKIPNIKKLGLSYENSFTKEVTEYCLGNLGLLKKLESLSLDFYLAGPKPLPDVLSNVTFPSSLKKLSLGSSIFRWEDMTLIGSLPHLEVLKLRGNYLGGEWVTVDGEFCSLKYLILESCPGLVQWRSDSSHFPCLELLELVCVTHLEEIPSGFGDIPTLQHIRLVWCSDSAVISAKKILVEQEEFGNDSLRVDVHHYPMNAEIESLASDNFVVD